MSNPAVAFWIAVALASAGFGSLYGILFGDGFSNEGVVYGLFIGLLAVAYERGLYLSAWSVKLRRLPTLPYLVAVEASLLAVVVAAIVLAGTTVWAFDLGNESFAESVWPKPLPLAYSMAVSVLFVAVLRVRDLIGAEIFLNLLRGRYRRPVAEERVFLFLDLEGSTAYAEAHGDLAAQELLRAVFAAIAEPVRRTRGQVDDYVGDLAIVSWPMARGLRGGACVACVFAVRQALDKDAARWRAGFGLVPRLHAALHGGSVVTAEVGVDRHKIAYFGDVMNATARIEALCREAKRDVLVSGPLLARLGALPPGIRAEPLGERPLRGRAGTMPVFALHDAAEAAAPRPPETIAAAPLPAAAE